MCLDKLEYMIMKEKNQENKMEDVTCVTEIMWHRVTLQHAPPGLCQKAERSPHMYSQQAAQRWAAHVHHKEPHWTLHCWRLNWTMVQHEHLLYDIQSPTGQGLGEHEEPVTRYDPFSGWGSCICICTGSSDLWTQCTPWTDNIRWDQDGHPVGLLVQDWHNPSSWVES